MSITNCRRMKCCIIHSAILFSIQILLNASMQAQGVIRCGTALYLQSREEKYPGTLQQLNEERTAAQQWTADHPGAVRSAYIIPVVVHVVWHTPQENISLSAIQSQIEVLNEDFNRQNADTSKTPSVWKSAAGSVPVLFCLAQYAPDGSDTSGITRTYTDRTSFDADDGMKDDQSGGASGWPSESYLNVWVCNLVSSTTNQDILGYASFAPGTANDGVVITYDAFGRTGSLKPQYDEGRTCTHEVGHWLNLVHTFDGGCSSSDKCTDTPKEFISAFGCPVFPLLDKCSPDFPGVMFMNYMDYTDDDCMNLFTQCQCNTMIGILNTSRQSLMLSPAGCLPVQLNLDASISTVTFPSDTLPAQAFQPQVQLSNRGLYEITFVEINFRVDGQSDSTFDYEGNLPSQLSTLVTLPWYFTGEGGHVFYAWTSNPNHGNDQFVFNDSSDAPFFVSSSVVKNATDIAVQQESPTDFPIVIVQNPSAAIMHLQVINMLGQMVQEGNWSVINHPAFIVDLSDLPNGVYFLYGKIGYDYVKKKVMVLRR